MGHTSKSEKVANPNIRVIRYHDSHYEASFDNAVGKFGAKTLDEAIDNMIAWFERGVIRAEAQIEDGQKTLVAYREAISQMELARKENRIVQE